MINIKNAKYFAIILLLTGAQVTFYTKTTKSNNVKIVDASLTLEENKVINILEELISSKGNGKTLQQNITEIVNTIKSNPSLIKRKPEYKLACDVLTEVNTKVLAGIKVFRSSDKNVIQNKITQILNKYNLKSLENTLPDSIIKYFKNSLIKENLITIPRNGKNFDINKNINQAKALLIIKKRFQGK